MVKKTNYSELIDKETWDFIKKTAAWYPDNTAERPIADQREIYTAMCREFFTGYPAGVEAQTMNIKAGEREIRIRRYCATGSNPLSHVVYYHGGGFVVGDLESHDDVCAEICDRTGFPVTSVDYRMAPEHPFPACHDDAVASFEHIAGKTDRPIVVAGDSAGGNLAAAVCHSVRGRPRRPAGQVLIYPGLTGDYTKGSYVTHARAPMLGIRDLEFYREIRSPGVDIAGDPRAAPLSDTDFSDLPPTVAISAECDPLSDDGRDYRDAILAAGGKAVWFNEKGLVHGYLRARHTVRRAKASFDRIIQAIEALGSGQWPYAGIGD